MKKKELILILAYCNTKDKKKTLFEFLDSLQKFRNEYDILVSSHTPLDGVFFEYFDYFYYDKNNIILDDLEYRQNGWFSPFNDYVIWSSYLGNGNTIKAILDLLSPSISLAKILNYDKIHYFEYDTKMDNNKELLDNSKLLDVYDYVIYNAEDTHKISGGFLSFKTNFVVDEWKVIDDKIFETSYFGVYPKVPENILYNQIQKQRKFIEKDYYSLKENGLFINTQHENYSNWDVPFFDPRDLKLKFVSYNKTSDNYDIKIYVNDTLHNLGLVSPNSWKIINLLENFYDVENIKVFKNDVKVLDIDFKTNEFKDKFKHYNSALDNSSILI